MASMLERFRERCWERLGVDFGASWGRLGVVLGRLGSVLVCRGRVLGPLLDACRIFKKRFSMDVGSDLEARNLENH